MFGGFFLLLFFVRCIRGHDADGGTAARRLEMSDKYNVQCLDELHLFSSERKIKGIGSGEGVNSLLYGPRRSLCL